MTRMERKLIVERTREGMAKARRYGTRSGRPVGRPPGKIPASFNKYYPMWKDGDITVTDFARLIGVIGHLNKYPTVAQAARELVHWCKIVAHEEKTYSTETPTRKVELGEKHKYFLKECDKYLEDL